MNPYQFFLKHAGYSYDPQTQTPMQGRVRNARNLAAAERKARDAGIYYVWNRDTIDSSEWSNEHPPYAQWVCLAIYPPEVTRCQPTVGASLGGIDFGRDGEPWGAPYRRVVEAELALEALEQLEVQS